MDLSQAPPDGDADRLEPDEADLPKAAPALHPWRWRVVLGMWIIVAIGGYRWLDREPGYQTATSPNDLDHLADGITTPPPPSTSTSSDLKTG